MTPLWEPTTVGALDLPHRLAMAPMTRSRASADGVPTPLMAEYYAQRASTALITSDGTQPSEDGQGYILTPGVHTPEHVAGWTSSTPRSARRRGRLSGPRARGGNGTRRPGRHAGRRPARVLVRSFRRGGAHLRAGA